MSYKVREDRYPSTYSVANCGEFDLHLLYYGFVKYVSQFLGNYFMNVDNIMMISEIIKLGLK